jgi:DNA polymerase-1
MSQHHRPVKAGDHVFLVDGSSYIFRAYHALPPLTRKADNLPVGAVSGFSNMLWRLLRDTIAGEKPTHLAVIFDHSSKTFRDEIYAEYKQNRPDPPEDLVPQFALVREATHAFDIACVEQENYEADDLIATYARLATEAGATVTIVASDKDLMQLVDDRVTMFDTMKDKRIGIPEVIEKFGVPPEKVVDVQALAGDSVDNVPGVPGIGLKTAAQLINEYGNVEMLLERAGEIKQPKRRESLIENAENARVSKKLVTLDRHVPLDHPIDSLAVHDPDPKRLIAFLKALDFSTLTRRVAETYRLQIAEIEPDHRLAGEGAWSAKRGTRIVEPSANGVASLPEAPVPASRPSTRTASAAGEPGSPADLVATRQATGLQQPFAADAYQLVTTPEVLDLWLNFARETGVVALYPHLTGIDPLQAEIAGLSLCVAEGYACYIPLNHRAPGGDLFGGGELLPGQMPEKATLAAIVETLDRHGVLAVGLGLKPIALALMERGLLLRSIDDVQLISYVLDAGLTGHDLSSLSERHLSRATRPLAEIAGAGRAAVAFDRLAPEAAGPWAAEQADAVFRLWKVLKPRLSSERMTTVYETLERGMVGTLARVEQRGIAIDRQMLSRLSGEFAQTMARLEHEIHAAAGEAFNIGSPKQLGDILFGKLGLPAPKKTATGAYTTSAQVLEELAEQGHGLPRMVLDWRQVAKLKSTYTDALPSYVNPRTQRVHTTYALAATTTGRLSSNEPNLQNIPVRTEEGRKIRTAFVATPGNLLLSADYSQIELRLLAHIAEIPQLRQAFADGDDIHAITASEMFGVPVQGMPAEVRRRAKAINFGIVYGISAFGLANQLGIPREEAGAYIKKYFERFPGIRDYMEETKAFCRANGYVTTIFGRKMHYPEIKAANPSIRANNERAAINAPIQGSAADIIRRAMQRMDHALWAAKLKARMLLQVHDELVFELPEGEVDATIPVVRKVMENAAEPAIDLRVPLQVDARAAKNWDEAH